MPGTRKDVPYALTVAPLEQSENHSMQLKQVNLLIMLRFGLLRKNFDECTAVLSF